MLAALTAAYYTRERSPEPNSGWNHEFLMYLFYKLLPFLPLQQVTWMALLSPAPITPRWGLFFPGVNSATAGQHTPQPKRPAVNLLGDTRMSSTLSDTFYCKKTFTQHLEPPPHYAQLLLHTLPVLKVTVLTHFNYERQHCGEAGHAAKTLLEAQVFQSNHVLTFIFSSPQLSTSASPLLASVSGPSPGPTCSCQIPIGQAASHSHDRSRLGWRALPQSQPPPWCTPHAQKCCHGQAAACETLHLWEVWKIS